MNINDVEVFATGTHNGDEFTERDLDQIVEAFKELDYRPAVKVGHTKETDGMPAFGWVTALKRVGKKLVANLSDVPGKIYDLVRAHQLDRVSAEIYFNLERGGKTFRRALKAVALLGVEVPAVANLAPLREAVLADAGSWRAYEYSPDDVKQRDEGDDPNGVKLHRRVVERMERTGEKSYSVALFAETRSYIKSPNEVAVNQPAARGEAANEEMDRRVAGETLTKRAREIQAKTGGDFMSCFDTAMHEMPNETQRYLRFSPFPMTRKEQWAGPDNLARARHDKPISEEGGDKL